MPTAASRRSPAANQRAEHRPRPVGLRLAGPATRLAGGGPTPLAYLASLARGDGSIAYAPGAQPTPIWTTAQALLGLTAVGKLRA